MSSRASSSSVSATESAFSRVSISTAGTELTSEFAALHEANLRSTSIHLPTRLPPPGTLIVDVDLSTLAVDPIYEGLPLGLVVSKLKCFGPALLRASTATSIVVPNTPKLPRYLSCEFSDRVSPLPSTRPSHILAVSSPDSPRVLLVPVHGLLWAAASPALFLLSSSPKYQRRTSLLPYAPPPTESSLPVFALQLPSSRAVPLLQSWIYLASAQALLQALIPPLPTPPSSLSDLLNPTPEAKSPRRTALVLSQLPTRTLLDRVQLVHGLWQNSVALEISDESLWATMGIAWGLLVAALGVQERRRLAI